MARNRPKHAIKQTAFSVSYVRPLDKDLPQNNKIVTKLCHDLTYFSADVFCEHSAYNNETKVKLATIKAKFREKKERKQHKTREKRQTYENSIITPFYFDVKFRRSNPPFRLFMCIKWKWCVLFWKTIWSIDLKWLSVDKNIYFNLHILLSCKSKMNKHKTPVSPRNVPHKYWRYLISAVVLWRLWQQQQRRNKSKTFAYTI